MVYSFLSCVREMPKFQNGPYHPMASSIFVLIVRICNFLFATAGASMYFGHISSVNTLASMAHHDTSLKLSASEFEIVDNECKCSS